MPAHYMARSRDIPIGLGLGLGTLVNCSSDDTSAYCQFAKIMNVIAWLITLFVLFYFAKTMFK